MTEHISRVIFHHLGWYPNARMQDRGSGCVDRSLQNPPATPDRAAVSGVPGGEYRYYHTQPNLAGGKKTTYLLIVCTLVTLAVIVVAPVPDIFRPVFLLLALLLLVNALFTSLTVAVTSETLEFWFGAGIWHKKYRLTGISGCSVVKNSWWYGWGIRWTPNGWLYNVAGRDAVEVLFQDGRKIRIGTDEPETLAGVINRALS